MSTEEVKKEEKAPVEKPAKKAAAKTAAKKAEPKMYVGPTIPGVAIQNVVYTAIPAAALEAKKDVPEIMNLFIPVKQYGEAERMIRTRKGYIANAYQKAETYKANKNKGGHEE